MLRLLITVVAAGLGWLLWLSIRNFITPSPLDKIPGPKPASWIKGKWLSKKSSCNSAYTYPGNLPQLFNRHSWDFLDTLGTKYNKVVKLTGLFGVRPDLSTLTIIDIYFVTQ